MLQHRGHGRPSRARAVRDDGREDGAAPEDSVAQADRRLLQHVGVQRRAGVQQGGLRAHHGRTHALGPPLAGDRPSHAALRSGLSMAVGPSSAADGPGRRHHRHQGDEQRGYSQRVPASEPYDSHGQLVAAVDAVDDGVTPSPGKEQGLRRGSRTLGRPAVPDGPRQEEVRGNQNCVHAARNVS